MSLDTYEIKIKYSNDLGINWECLPIAEERAGSVKTIGRYCRMLAAADSDIYEIRFNRAGFLQGHYVPGFKWSV